MNDDHGDIDREALAERLAAGDPGAFTGLLERYADRLAR